MIKIINKRYRKQEYKKTPIIKNIENENNELDNSKEKVKPVRSKKNANNEKNIINNENELKIEENE